MKSICTYTCQKMHLAGADGHYNLHRQAGGSQFSHIGPKSIDTNFDGAD